MSNVFGAPISVKEYPAKSDRAAAALERKDGKPKLLAQAYVDDQKSKYGNGVSTLGLIYNATGDPIVVLTSRNWHGHIVAPYPTVIQNGQWGGFLHGKEDKIPGITPEGSGAAVVYRGKAMEGEYCDFVIAWDNPWNKLSYSNHVTSLIRKAGSFPNDVWNTIYKNNKNGTVSTDIYNGCFSSVDIDEGTSPYLRAVIASL